RIAQRYQAWLAGGVWATGMGAFGLNATWSNARAEHNDRQQGCREALIERIHQYGVAGLGGAGFPTGVKLQGGGDKITTLIINAA
ncbi:hypothetical protein MJM59_32470, partial [Salmonella enterica subsp. enterica serovar Montevideo]|nr:hypothetical protein [Salmonella enterica subsp. enterica serovar Montevideo]